jgi:hypothetical protein
MNCADRNARLNRYSAQAHASRQQWRNFGPSDMFNVARSRRCESVGVGAHGCIIDRTPLERSSPPKLPPNHHADCAFREARDELIGAVKTVQAERKGRTIARGAD